MLAASLEQLALLGRQGPRALAVLVLIGIALPPLGSLMRPWLAEAVFLLLTISFLRLDIVMVRAHLRRPCLILAATLWTALGVPLLLYSLAGLVGLREREPGLFLGLMLQGLASPMMAAPSLAALMGLDATLVLITLVTGTALLPFVAPFLAQMLLGEALVISPFALGTRLGAILAGSILLAVILRRLIGMAALERHRDAVNGINVLVLLVFVSAVMGDVALMAWSDPVSFLGLTVLAFSVFGALLLGTALLFRRAGRIESLSLGIMASQRNMGLMVAAADGALPGATWLYFSLCQFPIYLSPLLLRPVLKAGGRLPIRQD
jgi:BASS family bile acid:Na+ symporter